MARVFITGSADGLKQLAANALIKEGQQVVLLARNEDAKQALEKGPAAEPYSLLLLDHSSNQGTCCTGQRYRHF